MTTWRLGTRASALAQAQANWVADLLRSWGHQVELVPVRTEGDVSTRPLVEIGGTGVFAAALRVALRAGEIDLAVHSLKDLPVTPEPGLVIAAVPTREDVRDVLVSRDRLRLDDLPDGSRIGTGSPRRAAQLRLMHPGVEVVDIRGNVDTRIGLVDSGKVDAVVLAAAGLRRLGRQDRIVQEFDPSAMVPAPGQGALALECRSDDTALQQWLGVAEDADTRRAVDAERELLALLEAGCSAPVGAWCTPGQRRGEWSLTGFVGLGRQPQRHRVVGDDPSRLAATLGETLLAGEHDSSEHPSDETNHAATVSSDGRPELEREE